MNPLLENVTKEELNIAEGLAKLYLEASVEQIDLTHRIASALPTSTAPK